MKDLGNRKMAEAVRNRIQAREFRSMAKGAAVAGKVVPDALLAAELTGVPPELADVVKANLARLVELAGDKAADVVQNLDRRAVAADARAEVLEQVGRELLGAPPLAPGEVPTAVAVITPPEVAEPEPALESEETAAPAPA